MASLYGWKTSLKPAKEIQLPMDLDGYRLEWWDRSVIEVLIGYKFIRLWVQVPVIRYLSRMTKLPG